MIWNRLVLFYCVLGLFSCDQMQTIRQVIQPKSPHERYAQALEKSGMDRTRAGTDWLIASQRALGDSTRLELPAVVEGYFRPDRVEAFGYQLDLQRGERLVVNYETEPTDLLLFLDVFQHSSSASPHWVISADTAFRQIDLEIVATGTYTLRVQPELLAAGRFSLHLRSQPSISMPVEGAKNNDIGSFFGDPRDGGRRKHKGIDIFAKKGTPTVAAVSGVVSSVRNGGLGGKTVWLRDVKHGRTLYYAHLDSQLVRKGQLVRAGDPVGTVGNTGNARTTPPHLHFSIYTADGAIDPLPFVKTQSTEGKSLAYGAEQLMTPRRLNVKRENLRTAPSAKSKIWRTITRNVYLDVLGGSGGWLHVRLTDGTTGFVYQPSTVSLDVPLTASPLEEGTLIRLRPDATSAPIATVAGRSSVDVLALATNGARWVQLPSGHRGWWLD